LMTFEVCHSPPELGIEDTLSAIWSLSSQARSNKQEDIFMTNITPTRAIDYRCTLIRL